MSKSNNDRNRKKDWEEEDFKGKKVKKKIKKNYEEDFDDLDDEAYHLYKKLKNEED